MKRKLLVLIFGFLLFASCKEQQIQRDIEPYYKKLDIQKFMENKYKWKALGIKNYSFKYSFRDDIFLMYGIDKLKDCVGNVVVRNGVGTVTFEGSRTIPDKNNPDEKYFYITSIDEAFDNVLEYYFKYQNMIREGKVGELYVVKNAWYEKDYFFLDSLFLQAFRVRATRPLTIYFEIKDFKVLE